MRAAAVSNTTPASRFWLISLAMLGLGVLFLVGVPTAAFAQDEARAVTLGRQIYAGKANCSQCHGWHANGFSSHMGNGPSLRTTSLDREGLVETISCGRPGTYMPYHIALAFTPSFPCYGISDKADLGGLGTAVGIPLQPREINNLVEFLLKEVVGAGPITLEYCIRYYGPESRNCDEYRGGA
ncbi:MAG: cytochrome c [Proteobacteria bacterium]|nr:cytochrome c [Pseudomonadota bacterium]MDA1132624.1 cytochrome c [Pseudomonadota bacterium]